MSDIKIGDRISWPTPVFPGPTAHPTEREYGTIEGIIPRLPEGRCYQVRLEADLNGMILIGPENARKEPSA